MTRPTPRETARALLSRHGLPEDVVDGVLCLHAQELEAVLRRAADGPRRPFESAMGQALRRTRYHAAADLIAPTKDPQAVPAPTQPDYDQALHAKLDEATATLRRIRSVIKDWEACTLPHSQAHRLFIQVRDGLAGPRPDPDEPAGPAASTVVAFRSSRMENAIRAELRRLADEQPEATTPTKHCAHCGAPIRLITGTLTAWWVHNPGGNTICHPEHAATSTRATPKPTAEAQQDQPPTT